ncbi:MAG: hypothetical protein IT307_11965 [Chloroflexi bacterium]|nr:hypothetical protein [Chloroflexota bacterium]
MEIGARRSRRVVTGNDENGKSKVFFDGLAPNAIGAPGYPGGGMLELWRWETCPVRLEVNQDLGNLPFHFEPTQEGTTVRIVQSPARPADYVVPPEHKPRVRPGGTWDRGGQMMHKTETVDYGIVMEGERVLVLDDGEYLLNQGDVVVQVGAWHGWASPRIGVRMAFIMIYAPFEG